MSNSLYEYNYIRMARFPGSDIHVDGIQGSGSTNYTIRFNVIDVPAESGGNAAVFVQAYNGTANQVVRNVRVEANYLRGGNYVLFLNGGKTFDGSNPASWIDDYAAIGNVFSPTGYRYGFITATHCPETITAGNRMENGTPINEPC